MTDGGLLGAAQPAPVWLVVAQQAGVTPFEAKALYVAGMMRHLVEAAGRCLRPYDGAGAMELPAYVLLADAVEILGRCHLGDADERGNPTRRLEAGFRLLMPNGQPIVTSFREYDIRACVSLRHFTTHGASTPPSGTWFDRELINELLRRLADQLNAYWLALRAAGDPLRDRLNEANIGPLSVGGRVVQVQEMRDLLHGGQRPGDALLYENAWRS